MEDEVRRTRTYRLKSHRGCTSCKNLRRKCGEEKPTCHFCVKERRKCEYDFDSLLRFQAYTPPSKGKPERTVTSKETLGDQTSCEDVPLERPNQSSKLERAAEPVSLKIVMEEPQSHYSITLHKPVPPAPENIVDPMDIPYLNYWNLEMHKMHPFAPLFPNLMPSLFQLATSTPPLRHSIISLSALVADNKNHRPIQRALLHHQETIRKVQRYLTPNKVDEAIIYTVMMLAYFNVFTGKLFSAYHHIRGLSLLLQNYVAGRQPGPMVMLIWRCGLRVDYMISSIYPCKPVFPAPSVEQEEVHRGWINKCVGRGKTGEELALAQFALDNLQSRAAHLSWRVCQLRRIHVDAELEIQEECTKLLDDFAVWRDREVLMDQDVKSPGDESTDGTFLGYPLLIRDPFFAGLLNEYRCAVIFVTFIASPTVGRSSPYDTLRTTHAIGTCRLLKTMGASSSFPVPLVRILQLVGLAFANSTEYPEECAWIEEQLEIVAHRGIIGSNKVKEMLKVVWKNPQQWTYESTERLIQNATIAEQFGL